MRDTASGWGTFAVGVLSGLALAAADACTPSPESFDSKCTGDSTWTMQTTCAMGISGFPSSQGDCIRNLPPDAGPPPTRAQRDAYDVAACKASHAGEGVDCVATHANLCRPDGGRVDLAGQQAVIDLCFPSDGGVRREETCVDACIQGESSCARACSATTQLGCWDCWAGCGLTESACIQKCP
jgi:hypothetical protein